jgi:hypothetical protein
VASDHAAAEEVIGHLVQHVRASLGFFLAMPAPRRSSFEVPGASPHVVGFGCCIDRLCRMSSWQPRICQGLVAQRSARNTSKLVTTEDAFQTLADAEVPGASSRRGTSPPARRAEEGGDRGNVRFSVPVVVPAGAGTDQTMKP